MKKLLLACLSFLVFAFPCPSQAEVRKCVTPSGETIYTDQPCNAKIGSTATEVKNDSTLRKITAMQKDRDTGKSCWVLDHRYSQCSSSIDRTLMTNFKENCGIPMNQFTKDRSSDNQSISYKNYRERREYREASQEGDDLEYVHRYTRKSRAVLQCEVLEKDMWRFLKQNFIEKVPQEDAKNIELRLLGLPDPEKSNSYSKR
ncbi:DUF4124 domain-containing protein [Undibacterium sp. Ji83W]|uniref:DUF4124 domain-containing protein n=1 Tax=Undibacterium sp. Ji83W TaxID=3413043 RepID=UPI003BF240AE